MNRYGKYLLQGTVLCLLAKKPQEVHSSLFLGKPAKANNQHANPAVTVKGMTFTALRRTSPEGEAPTPFGSVALLVYVQTHKKYAAGQLAAAEEGLAQLLPCTKL